MALVDADTVGGVGPGVFGSTQIHLGTTFKPRNSTQTYTYAFNGAISTTSSTERFTSQVWLPQGATVTGMTMYYSNATSGTAGIAVVRRGTFRTEPATSISSPPRAPWRPATAR